MGNSKSLVTEEQLDEYCEFTYMTKTEILLILKKFSLLGRKQMETDLHHRFHVAEVMELFPQLKYNPFRDRLFRVFSSEKDERYSFEDFLDLCSAMHEDCPLDVKALWAFRVYDFDEDERITQDDIKMIVDRLVLNHFLDSTAKEQICEVILQEMDFLISVGYLTESEFQYAMAKIPNLAHYFRFRV